MVTDIVWETPKKENSSISSFRVENTNPLLMVVIEIWDKNDGLESLERKILLNAFEISEQFITKNQYAKVYVLGKNTDG